LAKSTAGAVGDITRACDVDHIASSAKRHAAAKLRNSEMVSPIVGLDTILR
jgi:hypothetical protein